MQALILMGSPKAKKSNSYAIASYLIEKLENEGVRCHTIHILANFAKLSEIINYLEKVDILILSSPLYSCALPSHVTYLFERVYSKKTLLPKKDISTFLLVNSGFPESNQNEVAVDVFKNWSLMCGFDYKGAAQIGMGPALGGKALSKKSFTRKLRSNLSVVAKNLANNRRISPLTIENLKRPFFSRKSYRNVATIRYRFLFNKARVKPDLQPYLYKN